MIPSKFRQNSGPKKSPQQPFTPGFKSATSSSQMPNPMAHMPGSMPGTMSGSAPGAISQRKPLPPISTSSAVGGARQQSPHTVPKSMLLPRQRNASVPDPRRVIVDHIIRDCYSKSVVVDGRKVPEIKYNTHLSIREYASYPSAPPPPGLSPAQIGSVKTRILVVCTKHTGRVLLQKGKYNDSKKVYQIGRTWDLDELLCVSRMADDAFVLSLNKEYYWKSAEDPGRLQKFLHHLAVIHQRFTGHFPQMKGFTLESLGLSMSTPASAVSPTSGTFPQSRDVSLNSAPLSAPPTNTPQILPQAAPKQAAKPPGDHYKDMDFTVNGTLPVKPMQVMDVDRPSPSTMSSATFEDAESTQRTSTASKESPYPAHQDGSSQATSYDRAREFQKKPTVHADHGIRQASLNDTQSFVFAADETAAGNKVHDSAVSEHSRSKDMLLPVSNPKPDQDSDQRPHDLSENSGKNASHGLQIETQLKDHESDSGAHKFDLKIPNATEGVDSVARNDDSIEEASLTGSSIDSQTYMNSHGKQPETHRFLGEGTRKDSVIDDSIRDIENFMETEFGPEPKTPESSLSHSRSPSKSLAKKLSVPFKDEEVEDLNEISYDEKIPESVTMPPVEKSISPPEEELNLEKDPEIEELLDEIAWNPTDGSDKCVKLLQKELMSIKHKNISELTTLDFGKDNLSDEVKIASDEIHNLVEIFKKLEVNFKMIAPQINSIENNSKGLQVEAVNKKILYNELSEIMQKVRLSERDLALIANYDEFANISLVPRLEEKLLLLNDALGAIGNEASDDDLSHMYALKQFHEKYESVSSSFAQRYSAFILSEFQHVIEKLDHDISGVFPEVILSSFRDVYAFAGVNHFVKDVCEQYFANFNDKFNVFVANFLDNLLSSRIQAIRSGTSSARNSRLPDMSSNIKKNKSSRFGSTRFLSRVSGSAGDQSPKPKAADASTDEINDPRIIVRLANEGKEFMLVFQFFLGKFFHLTSTDDFSTFTKSHAFEERTDDYKKGNLDSINYKTNSNDLLRNMNAIFGNFINRFTREIIPSDIIMTQVLAGLYELSAEAESKDQDFVAYSFLHKLAERYKANWDRFIIHQVDLLNKSDIRAKGGVIPAVRNLNQIIATIETSSTDPLKSKSDVSGIDMLISQTYSSLTKAANDLLSREDPLLKSNTHDEKERAHRNVAILQNLFSILQQLGEYSSTAATQMRDDLNKTFSSVQNEYFDYVTRVHLGKIGEFVNGYSSNDVAGKKRKEEKILVRGICSTYSSKDMVTKINDMLKTMQKHVISSDTVFEHDLLELMWKNLEEVVVGVFREFHDIARSIDRDIDEGVSSGEIRRLFNEEYKLKR